jgi:hypothetical protein
MVIYFQFLTRDLRDPRASRAMRRPRTDAIPEFVAAGRNAVVEVLWRTSTASEQGMNRAWPHPRVSAGSRLSTDHAPFGMTGLLILKSNDAIAAHLWASKAVR